MKRRIMSIALAALTILGLLSGCGGGGGGNASGGAETEAGDGGKVLNIYVWNQEFQGNFNDNYPDVEKLSNYKSFNYL